MKLFSALLFTAVIFMPAALLHGQVKTKEFALYVLPDKASIGKVVKKPAGEPLISIRDVDFYQKDRHELGLGYMAGKRIREIAAKQLAGRKFGVFVGDDLIYVGAFLSVAASGNYRGVSMDTKFGTSDFPVVPIRYNDTARGADPRSDPRLLKAFEDAKMLRQELVIKGRCIGMHNTMKRRASVVFSFTVNEVLKGNYTENEIVFETYADGEGGKLLEALESTDTPYGDTRTFDKVKQITLKFEQRTDLNKQPYWFWFRSIE